MLPTCRSNSVTFAAAKAESGRQLNYQVKVHNSSMHLALRVLQVDVVTQLMSIHFGGKS